MRKTIVPVAIVLAASAVPMQAQELTYAAIQEEIEAVYATISSYPTAVEKDIYLSQLKDQKKLLSDVKDDDEDKITKYEAIAAAVAKIKEDAAKAEKPYAAAREAALKAITDAKEAYETANQTINGTADQTIKGLDVPSVREKYTTQLQALEVPAEPAAADLYESIDLSDKTKERWEAYKTQIVNLESEARSANQTEMDAQRGYQDTLESMIGDAQENVQGKLSLVGSYVVYDYKVDHLKAINGVAGKLTTFRVNVEKLLSGWNLTESKYENCKSKIEEQVNTLTDTANAAENDALKKAAALAADIVSDLTKNTEYTDFGPDGYTKAAKEAANDSIKAAQDAEKELAKQCVQDDYDALKGDVEDKVTAANNAIAAVTSCVNNHTDYAALKSKYETLKKAYDLAAIELSTLKADGKIDGQFYNEANTKLNEVDTMLKTFATTNQDKYDKYDGKSNADYTKVMELLDPAYDEADEIQQIVEDAKAYNDTLATLTGYQTEVEGIIATVSHDKADDNEVYATAVNTLNEELEGTKSGLATVLDGLVEVWRKDKTLGMTFDGIKQEISKLKDAIKTAQADLNAYVSSKEQVAAWTASVEAIEVILKNILDPVPTGYPAHDVLETDLELATTYKGDIAQLDKDVDDAFNASDRTSQSLWTTIDGMSYTTDLENLSEDVATYKAWSDAQDDVAAYNTGLQYCNELQDILNAAIAATASTALGFDDDQTAINKLRTEVKKHETGHDTNSCIAAKEGWYEQYVSIKASIGTHKQAWETNKSDYEAKLATLDGILDFEATQPNQNLYDKLNDTSTIDTAISTAKSDLKKAYYAQEASSFDAAAKQTEILNLIAQLKLQEDLDASGIGGDEGAISTVRKQLVDNKGWNPENNFYSKQLDEYEKTYNTLVKKYDDFTVSVQYAAYKEEFASITTLKSAVDAVDDSAEANYKAYTAQTKAQTAAKAVWAEIYSKVGAMYVDAEDPTDFSGAQKYYQGELNKCFEVLTNYDTLIEEAYNAGKSASFSTEEYEDYNKAIEENKAAMEAIKTLAQDNKDAYDGQMEMWGILVNYYNGQVTDLKNKIDAVVSAIAGASETDVKALKEQETALNQAKDDLSAVKTTIEELKEAVVAAVNKGESAKYAYDTEDTNICSTINTIISTATGKYNDNIKAHNEVVLKLFKDAYKAAKAAYNNYTLQIEEYAGYTHALDENGVSAYAAEIEKAQKAIFDLNTNLVARYNNPEPALSSPTEYVDKKQENKAAVNDLKVQLDDAYKAFLKATKAIADKNGYAEPLSDLAVDYYDPAKTAIEKYTIITDITATPDEEAAGITDAKKQADAVAAYFKVLDCKDLYATYTQADYAGPQYLDALLEQVEGQTAKVLTAWNNAAKDEAEAAKTKAQASYDILKDKKYPTGYTPWKNALTAANDAIVKAGTDITTYSDTKELNVKVDGIKTALEDAISALKTANTTAEADYAEALKAYDTYSDNIEKLKKDIERYKDHMFAADLNDLITTANDAVAAYETANEDAFNALYTDTKTLDDAETVANEAYEELVTTADKLVQANPPAGIVATLLAKAQELMPLYNRAEANAKGHEGAEKTCVAIYEKLNALLTTLRTTDNAKKEEIATNKTTYEAQIEKLKADIIAADLEQVAYTDLLEKQAKVAQELEAVKTTISGSVFADALNTTFKADMDGIATSLYAAATQINIDHANNRCGKEGAYSLEQLAGISTEISNLSAKVDAEIAKLAKAEADEATRTANKTAYDAATAVISELSNELVAQWCVAQGQNLDVYTLFAEKVTTLHTEIEGLQTSLDAAYEAAQNVNEDPSKLDTSDYTTNSANIQSYYNRIKTLMGDISARQTQFEVDVTSLKEKFKAMNTAFLAIKISDVAAENEDVQKEKDAIDAVIREIKEKMQEENFGPKDIETVQGLIDAANTRITAFATLVAGKTYVPGDITGTGSVDINDTFKILALVLGKLSGDTLDEKAQKAADMDGDEAFTVADLVQINNLYVYGSKTGPQGSNRVAAAADAEVGSVDMQLDTDRMSVLLDSNTGYSAIQMDVEMPQGVSINEVNFAGDSQKVMVATNTLENGVQRIVIYSTDGSSILNGETSLINLGLAGEGMGIVSIDNIIASTAVGQRHNLMGVTGAYTIVTGIEATETAEGNTSVFDINGMVRKTVQKGVNIVKDAAGKVKKMLMK